MTVFSFSILNLWLYCLLALLVSDEKPAMSNIVVPLYVISHFFLLVFSRFSFCLPTI